MRASMQQCGAGSDYTCFKNKGVQSDIDTLYGKYAPQLNPQQQQELKAYSVYVQSYIQLGTIYANTNMSKAAKPDALLNVLKVHSTTPGATDEFQQQLNTYYTTLINKLKGN
jgi:hypothetical protein